MHQKILLGTLTILMLLVATTGWAATLSLAWNPNTEDDLDGYRLYYGTTSRFQGSYTDVAVINDETATTFQLSDLSAGTYYFSLTAFDKAGNESGFSIEVSAVVPGEPLGKPGTPLLIQ